MLTIALSQDTANFFFFASVATSILNQFTFLMSSNEDGDFLMFMLSQAGQSNAFLLSASEMIENSTFRDVMDGSGQMDPSGLSGDCSHQPRSQRHLFRPLFRHLLFGPSTSTGRCLIWEVSLEVLLPLWGGEDPQQLQHHVAVSLKRKRSFC